MGNRVNRLRIIGVFLLAVALWLPLGLARAQNESALPVTHGSLIRNTARITFEWPQTVHFTAQANGKSVTIAFERNAHPDFGELLAKLYPYVTSAERKADGKTIVLTLDKAYRIRTFISDNVSGLDLLGIDPNKRRALLTQTADAGALSNLNPAAGEAVPDNDSAALAAGPVAAPAVNTSGIVKVNVSAATDNTVLRLPFTERVALAVFMRADSLWIVCNKPMKLDLTDFDNLPKTVIGKAELVPNPKMTILRVPVDNTVHVSVAKEENSFEWAILLTPKARALSGPLPVNINTDPPAPAHIFIPALEMTEPVSLHDPEIGDNMVITPLFNAGQGISARREFVEFTLLESAQGIAVVKKADDVMVTQIRDGLRISLPQGTTLTPGLPTISQSNDNDLLQGAATLFPYERWKLDEPLTPRHRLVTIEELFHRIVESKTLQEANQARLQLAELYLSEGMASEALGLLEGINRTNPVFYRSAKLAALHGAANFLMYRFTDAARDFSSSELNNNKEVDYWRSMIGDLLGNPVSYDYLSLNDDYISKYPPLFRQRLAIVAADRAIAAKEYNTALKIFDGLHQSKILDPIQDYANFLLAKISADTGQEKQATEMWDKLAENYKHPFVRARAEYSRIAWGMDHNALSKDEVIARLEKLRLEWHGDGLELQILTLLGDLYLEKKDYVNAMRIWDGAIVSFPNTAASIAMAQKMGQTFIVMFNDGAADALPTLDALALYYQYRNYTPSGATGNEMIGRLADRLISVDLLDQATQLLDRQMHSQSEKQQRSSLGAKLANIHLLNHQPKKALAALEDSVYGDNTVLVRQERNRLTAQALSALGQQDKALHILGDDISQEAEKARLAIYWQQKDWSRVAVNVENMLKTRKDNSAPLTIDESEALLKLAMAYIFENNAVQLQYLHDYFTPLMAHNPNKQLFDFITKNDITPTPTNFDEVIQRMAETREFVDHYHARIDTASATAEGSQDKK